MEPLVGQSGQENKNYQVKIKGMKIQINNLKNFVCGKKMDIFQLGEASTEFTKLIAYVEELENKVAVSDREEVRSEDAFVDHVETYNLQNLSGRSTPESAFRQGIVAAYQEFAELSLVPIADSIEPIV